MFSTAAISNESKIATRTLAQLQKKYTAQRLGVQKNATITTSAVSRDNVPTQNPEPFNLATYQRGTGGRSSFSGQVCTIFGASGTLGRILCNRFGKEGTQIVVPYRGDPWDLRGIKLCGDLGQIWFQEVDVRDPEKIRRALQYSNIAINCIGTDHETSNFSFRDVNVDAARLIAKIARECRIQKLIHISSLNASLNPQTIFKPSQYLITKYLGEMAVREEFPEAVIIRPSNMYGENDKFLNYYTNDLRRGPQTVQLWKKGEMTIKMPVHQSDVADGIMKIANTKDIQGVTYDFVGDERFLLSDIVDFIYQSLRRDITRIGLTPTRRLVCLAMEMVMKRPKYSSELIEREFISDAYSTDARNPTLKDLGIKFRKFEEMAGWHLKVYNKDAYYDDKLGEFKDPKKPPAISDDFEFQLRRKLRLSL